MILSGLTMCPALFTVPIKENFKRSKVRYSELEDYYNSVSSHSVRFILVKFLPVLKTSIKEAFATFL